jgi:hypothetical protein
MGVKTIPGTIGQKRTKQLAAGLLLLATGLAGLNTYLGAYPTSVLGSLIFNFALAGWLLFRARGTESDYYYTGLIDGTMILQFLFVFLVVLLT